MCTVRAPSATTAEDNRSVGEFAFSATGTPAKPSLVAFSFAMVPDDDLIAKGLAGNILKLRVLWGRIEFNHDASPDRCFVARPGRGYILRSGRFIVSHIVRHFNMFSQPIFCVGDTIQW